jgi:hypothetical protein
MRLKHEMPSAIEDMKSFVEAWRKSTSPFVCIGLLMLLVACGPIVTLNAGQDRFNEINDNTRPIPWDDKFLVDASNRFGLMALFAEIVYRRDQAKGSRDSLGCQYLKSSPNDPKQVDQYGMPFDDGTGSRWERWVPPVTMKGVAPCLNESGLYYETYVHVQENKIDQKKKITAAVIAFRGTEGRKGQSFFDWTANFSAFFGIEPKQYELASQTIPILVEALKSQLELDENGKFRIYATGHSLGGGLAQQAGYISKDIREVFTFNTSPVTNWSFLRLRGAVKNEYPTIYRIFHGGEIL